MNLPRRQLLFTAGMVLVLLSAICSGFLVGRTLKFKEEGKLGNVREVSEQVYGISGVVNKSGEMVKKILLR